MMNANSPSSLHGMALQQVQRPQRGLAVFGGGTEAHERTVEWGDMSEVGSSVRLQRLG